MENKKRVMVEFDFPGMSVKEYDQIWQDLRKAGYEHPKGLIHHAGAPTDKGVKIVDVWESADKFNEFGSALMPVLQKHGVKEPKPSIFPLHYEYNENKKPIM
ncbi:hypothetical protein SAMN05443667_10356 [Flavobacterium gillisiae]|uniref:ABM domain-containing protein n=1 Tax=Flavobacterium gillisiae TaxID=150146 RepID=A0A1H3ZSZ7_9FLAO|nr:hypothetical protein [Flavobacterium gillisiae]SEA26840.1 hypothetical protein SAMN05443667_10356 [Flavobacterium gillisiae]